MKAKFVLTLSMAAVLGSSAMLTHSSDDMPASAAVLMPANNTGQFDTTSIFRPLRNASSKHRNRGRSTRLLLFSAGACAAEAPASRRYNSHIR